MDVDAGNKSNMTAPAGSPGVKQVPKLPRGVIVLGLLLYCGSVISLMAGAVVPAELLAGLPRWVLLFEALVCAILATGLLLRRRWAWFAALAFVAVNAYYLVLGAAERGQNTLVGGTLLAIVAAYLLRPGVRSIFLQR